MHKSLDGVSAGHALSKKRGPKSPWARCRKFPVYGLEASVVQQEFYCQGMMEFSYYHAYVFARWRKERIKLAECRPHVDSKNKLTASSSQPPLCNGRFTALTYGILVVRWVNSTDLTARHRAPRAETARLGHSLQRVQMDGEVQLPGTDADSRLSKIQRRV